MRWEKKKKRLYWSYTYDSFVTNILPTTEDFGACYMLEPDQCHFVKGVKEHDACGWKGTPGMMDDDDDDRRWRRHERW